jgi:hypothetical protein
MKNQHDEEAEAFLDQPEDVPTINKKRDTWARSWSYIRLVLEIAMAATIVFLLFFRAPPSRNLRRSPVPERMLPSSSTSHGKLIIQSSTKDLYFPQ